MKKNVHNAISKNRKKANKILFKLCQKFDKLDASKSLSDSEQEYSKEKTTKQNLVDTIHNHN